MTEEQVILVDNQDPAVGLTGKMHAHQQGLLHRAFSVFVIRYNENNLEVLYNKEKLINTIAELYGLILVVAILALMKRLYVQRNVDYEEMGLHIKLKLLNSFIYRAEFANGLIEHEYDHVLIGYYNDEKIQANPIEVQNYKWVNLEVLKLDLLAHPDVYTPWLSPALNILQQAIRAKNS